MVDEKRVHNLKQILKTDIIVLTISDCTIQDFLEKPMEEQGTKKE